jgi:hypothetical protein
MAGLNSASMAMSGSLQYLSAQAKAFQAQYSNGVANLSSQSSDDTFGGAVNVTLSAPAQAVVAGQNTSSTTALSDGSAPAIFPLQNPNQFPQPIAWWDQPNPVPPPAPNILPQPPAPLPPAPPLRKQPPLPLNWIIPNFNPMTPNSPTTPGETAQQNGSQNTSSTAAAFPTYTPGETVQQYTKQLNQYELQTLGSTSSKAPQTIGTTPPETW